MGTAKTKTRRCIQSLVKKKKGDVYNPQAQLRVVCVQLWQNMSLQFGSSDNSFARRTHVSSSTEAENVDSVHCRGANPSSFVQKKCRFSSVTQDKRAAVCIHYPAACILYQTSLVMHCPHLSSSTALLQH
jgi:hypothetical protein